MPCRSCRARRAEPGRLHFGDWRGPVVLPAVRHCGPRQVHHLHHGIAPMQITCQKDLSCAAAIALLCLRPCVMADPGRYGAATVLSLADASAISEQAQVHGERKANKL